MPAHSLVWLPKSLSWLLEALVGLTETLVLVSKTLQVRLTEALILLKARVLRLSETLPLIRLLS
jgi:hypothetical protein